MSFGLQVFGQSGGVLVEYTDRLSRLIGVFTVSHAGGQDRFNQVISGTYSVPGMADDGKWIVFSPQDSGPNLYPKLLVKPVAGGFYYQLNDWPIYWNGSTWVTQASTEQVTIMAV